MNLTFLLYYINFICKLTFLCSSLIYKPFSSLQTFNEFFIRELKPGARPINDPECDDVAVCAADCRLMAYGTVEDSMRFWIKV